MWRAFEIVVDNNSISARSSSAGPPARQLPHIPTACGGCIRSGLPRSVSCGLCCRHFITSFSSHTDGNIPYFAPWTTPLSSTLCAPKTHGYVWYTTGRKTGTHSHNHTHPHTRTRTYTKVHALTLRTQTPSDLRILYAVSVVLPCPFFRPPRTTAKLGPMQCVRYTRIHGDRRKVSIKSVAVRVETSPVPPANYIPPTARLHNI